MEELVEVKGLGVWGAVGNTVQSELIGPQHQTLASLLATSAITFQIGQEWGHTNMYKKHGNVH